MTISVPSPPAANLLPIWEHLKCLQSLHQRTFASWQQGHFQLQVRKLRPQRKPSSYSMGTSVCASAPGRPVGEPWQEQVEPGMGWSSLLLSRPRVTRPSLHLIHEDNSQKEKGIQYKISNNWAEVWCETPRRKTRERARDAERHSTVAVTGWPKCRRLTTPSVDMGVEHLERSCLLAGLQNGPATLESCLAISSKLKPTLAA